MSLFISTLKKTAAKELHPQASAMMLHGLSEVYRYSDNPIVTPEFKFSVADHVNFLALYGQDLVTRHSPDAALTALLRDIINRPFMIPHKGHRLDWLLF